MKNGKTRLLHSTIRVGDTFLNETEIEVTEGTETAETEPNWLVAVRAAQSKKATEIKVLQLSEVTSFTDYFLLCNGGNSKQMQAITDEIGLQLKVQLGERPTSVEGYEGGEWILSDYSDLIVHVFSEKARPFYDLDRLWRAGKQLELPPDTPPSA